MLKLLLGLNNEYKTTHSIIEKALSYLNDRERIVEVRKKIYKSMESYQIENVYDLSGAFKPDWDPYESGSEFKQLEAFNIPQWFAKSLSQGRIGSFFITTLFSKRLYLTCKIEDFEQTIANTCARSIRQLMYSMLFQHMDEKPIIYEYDRSLRIDEKCQIEDHKISLKTEVNVTSIPSLSEVEGMEDPGQFMCLALGLDPNFQSG